MAKEALASEDLAKKFATEKETPYTCWIRAEGLDIIPALYVRNLRKVELKPWARRGGNAVFVNHDASRISNDSYVMEIPPGKKLEPHRQLFEEMILILEGRGSTTVWNNEGKRITFEWKAGSLFAIPLNAWHQHFNGSGTQAARYVGVTNAPPVINLYEDLDFIFGCDHDFKNRFNGEPDYFNGSGTQAARYVGVTNAPPVINLYEDLDFIFGCDHDFKNRFNGEPDYFNGSGTQAARYVGVTNAPPVINLYEDLDFIFGCDHDFKNRFNGEPDYFN